MAHQQQRLLVLLLKLLLCFIGFHGIKADDFRPNLLSPESEAPPMMRQHQHHNEDHRRLSRRQRRHYNHNINDSARIIAGTTALTNRYPYAVSVRVGNNHYCGGSLIAPDVVLSAAHCAKPYVDSVVINPMSIINDNNHHDGALGTTEQEERYAIRQRILHPRYNETSLQNDIALLLLQGNSTSPIVRVNHNQSIPRAPVSSSSSSSSSSPPSSPPPLNGDGNNNGQEEEPPTAITDTANSGTTNTDNKEEYLGLDDDEVEPAAEPKDALDEVWIVDPDTNGLGDLFNYSSLNDTTATTARGAANTHNLTVIGWGTTTTQDISPLLQQAFVEYTTNEGCVEQSIHNGEPGLTYVGRVTDDMMCAIEDGTGSCQGDSGGPLLLLSNDDDDNNNDNNGGDIQVGLVSWGFFCARARYPGVYARLSHESNWNFIRHFVCRLSSQPPLYMNCTDLFLADGGNDGNPDAAREATYSPFPSQAPMAPTFSPAPTTEQTIITLRIALDYYPQETGWRLETVDGDVIRKVEIGSYSGSGVVVEETFTVNLGASFRLVLEDRGGDGICCGFGQGNATVYLGESVDETQLLLFEKGEFRDEEFSAEFVVSPNEIFQIPAPTPAPVPLVVVVTKASQDPTFIEDVSWTLQRLDGPEGAVYVGGVQRGAYDVPGERFETRFMVTPGGLYSFTISHPLYTGFDGHYELYIGVNTTADTTSLPTSSSSLILSAQGSTIGRRQAYGFVAKDPFTDDTTELANRDRLTLEIRFDQFPSETEWFLRSITENKVVAFGPETVYDDQLKGQILTKELFVSSIPEGFRRDYEFTWTDAAGDGICCGFGQGYIRLWEGDAHTGTLLAQGRSGSTKREAIRFSRLSLAPTVSPQPSASPMPTSDVPPSLPPTHSPANLVDHHLSVKIEALFHSESLGWRLIDAASGTVLQEALPNFADIAPRLVTSVVVPNGGASAAYYQLEVFNSTGMQVDTFYTVVLNDLIVAKGSGNFASPHVHQMWIGPYNATVPVTVAMSTLDNNNTAQVAVDLVIENLPAQRVLQRPLIPGAGDSTITMMLWEGELYRLLLHGEPSASHHVVVGSADSAGDGTVILPPPAFKQRYPNSIIYSFVADPGYSSPAMTDNFLTLQLSFDLYPHESSWILYVGEENDCDFLERVPSSLNRQQRYTFGPIASYGVHLARGSTVELIPLPMTTNELCLPVTVVIRDSYGDGIDRTESFRIWEQGNSLRASGQVNDFAREVALVIGITTSSAPTPVVTPQPTIDASRPTPTPVITPIMPVLTLLPTQAPQPISATRLDVMIESHENPEVIGWRIFDSTNKVRADVQPGTYGDGVTVTIPVYIRLDPITHDRPLRFVLYDLRVKGTLNSTYTIKMGDKVLASGNCTFTNLRIHDFFVHDDIWSAEYPITVVMDTDKTDSGSGWNVHAFNESGPHELVVRGASMPKNQRIHATVLVEKHQLYRLQIINGKQHGFVRHFVFLGSTSADSGRTALELSSDVTFRFNTSLYYNVIPALQDSEASTNSDSNRSLTLELDVTENPGEIVWLLVSDYTDTDPTIYAYGPQVSYPPDALHISDTIPLRTNATQLDLVVVVVAAAAAAAAAAVVVADGTPAVTLSGQKATPTFSMGRVDVYRFVVPNRGNSETPAPTPSVQALEPSTADASGVSSTSDCFVRCLFLMVSLAMIR